VEPTFLSLDEVLAIHGDQIQRYGGAAGIRDMAALQSAIAMPAVGIGESYVHEDLPAMAGAYLFHIVRNHPFVDGNKRVGAVAALVFLDLNGVTLALDETPFEALVMDVVGGQQDKAAVITFLRRGVVA
jgi:death-on-curing protein